MIMNNKRNKIVTGACGMIVVLFMTLLNMGVAMAESGAPKSIIREISGNKMFNAPITYRMPWENRGVSSSMTLGEYAGYKARGTYDKLKRDGLLNALERNDYIKVVTNNVSTMHGVKKLGFVFYNDKLKKLLHNCGFSIAGMKECDIDLGRR